MSAPIVVSSPPSSVHHRFFLTHTSFFRSRHHSDPTTASLTVLGVVGATHQERPSSLDSHSSLHTDGSRSQESLATALPQTTTNPSRRGKKRIMRASVNALVFTLKSVVTHIPAPGLSAAVEGLVECIERYRVRSVLFHFVSTSERSEWLNVDYRFCFRL